MNNSILDSLSVQQIVDEYRNHPYACYSFYSNLKHMVGFLSDRVDYFQMFLFPRGGIPPQREIHFLLYCYQTCLHKQLVLSYQKLKDIPELSFIVDESSIYFTVAASPNIPMDSNELLILYSDLFNMFTLVIQMRLLLKVPRKEEYVLRINSFFLIDPNHIDFDEIITVLHDFDPELPVVPASCFKLTFRVK